MAKNSRVKWVVEIGVASVISVIAVRVFDRYFSKKDEPPQAEPPPGQNPAMVGMQPQPQYLVTPPVPPPMPMPVPFPVYTAAPAQQPHFPQMPQFPRVNPQEPAPAPEEPEEIIEEIDPVEEIEREWEENGWDA